MRLKNLHIQEMLIGRFMLFYGTNTQHILLV
jgi:hypothetical protein